MKNIGIWLDKEKAHVITLKNGKETIRTIKSEIENFRFQSKSGSNLKAGPKEVINERKYLERENHQLKAYFKNIAKELTTADAIVIFGPAETYIKFHKELVENYKHLNHKIEGIKNVDSMTNNQTIALVRNFFN
jgi:hypothetical protein